MFMLVITTILIIFRIKNAIHGTKVNVKKTIIFSAYFLAIASFLVYNSFLIGNVPIVYVILYLAVVVAASYCSYRYSRRTLSFVKLPNGDDGNSAVYVRGGLSIFLVYVVSLTIRIAINFLFIGSEKLYFNNQQTILGNGTAIDIMPMVHIDPATTVLALTITDLLLIVGAGLVVGRNASVLKYYYQEKERRMS
ncbi:MAG: hypothetical protein M3Y53_10035 [Thermoproteota archaeon]|nr:hypothetical protein [Thermoproteota archaeon]